MKGRPSPHPRLGFRVCSLLHRINGCPSPVAAACTPTQRATTLCGGCLPPRSSKADQHQLQKSNASLLWEAVRHPKQTGRTGPARLQITQGPLQDLIVRLQYQFFLGPYINSCGPYINSCGPLQDLIELKAQLGIGPLFRNTRHKRQGRAYLFVIVPVPSQLD